MKKFMILSMPQGYGSHGIDKYINTWDGNTFNSNLMYPETFESEEAAIEFLNTRKDKNIAFSGRFVIVPTIMIY